MTGLQFVTDLADAGVLLPVSVLVLGCMAVAGWRRGATAWTAGVGGAVAAVLGLKLAFLGCDGHAGFSASGHTAAAAAIYGGFGGLWLRRFMPGLAPTVLAASLAGLVIGTTRLALGSHSAPEAAAGDALGVGGALAFAALSGPVPAGFRLGPAALGSLLLVFGLHGVRLPIEPLLRELSGRLAGAPCTPPVLRTASIGAHLRPTTP